MLQSSPCDDLAGQGKSNAIRGEELFLTLTFIQLLFCSFIIFIHLFHFLLSGKDPFRLDGPHVRRPYITVDTIKGTWVGTYIINEKGHSALP